MHSIGCPDRRPEISGSRQVSVPAGEVGAGSVARLRADVFVAIGMALLLERRKRAPAEVERADPSLGEHDGESVRLVTEDVARVIVELGEAVVRVNPTLYRRRSLPLRWVELDDDTAFDAVVATEVELEPDEVLAILERL